MDLFRWYLVGALAGTLYGWWIGREQPNRGALAVTVGLCWPVAVVVWGHGFSAAWRRARRWFYVRVPLAPAAPSVLTVPIHGLGRAEALVRLCRQHGIVCTMVPETPLLRAARRRARWTGPTQDLDGVTVPGGWFLLAEEPGDVA